MLHWPDWVVDSMDADVQAATSPNAALEHHCPDSKDIAKHRARASWALPEHFVLPRPCGAMARPSEFKAASKTSPNAVIEHRGHVPNTIVLQPRSVSAHIVKTLPNATLEHQGRAPNTEFFHGLLGSWPTRVNSKPPQEHRRTPYSSIRGMLHLLDWVAEPMQTDVQAAKPSPSAVLEHHCPDNKNIAKHRACASRALSKHLVPARR